MKKVKLGFVYVQEINFSLINRAKCWLKKIKKFSTVMYYYYLFIAKKMCIPAKTAKIKPKLFEMLLILFV